MAVIGNHVFSNVPLCGYLEPVLKRGWFDQVEIEDLGVKIACEAKSYISWIFDLYFLILGRAILQRTLSRLVCCC